MFQLLRAKSTISSIFNGLTVAEHRAVAQCGAALHEAELVCEGAIHIRAVPKAERNALLHDLTEFGLDALPLVVALNPATGLIITIGKMAEGLYEHAGDGHTVIRVFADACIDVVSDPLSAAMSGMEIMRDLEHAGQAWELTRTAQPAQPALH
jgi:hypothetical protein